MNVQGVPHIGAGAVAGVAAQLGLGKVRGQPAAEVLTTWLRDTGRRVGSADFVIGLGPRKVFFVASPELSNFILDKAPSDGDFVAGTMKRKAMSFLAPRALTILSNEPWREMRGFNETVLGLGEETADDAVALTAARFAAPLADIADVRERMGAVMLDLIFAGKAPEGLAATIRELFGEVTAKTALLGSRKTDLRDRFHADLARLWAESDEAGSHLLARARRAAAALPAPYNDEAFLLSQIPHWMFTFTGSGSDLLAASLALIQARPDVFKRARDEVSGPDPGNRAPTREPDFVEACVREAGRLFPPAPQVSHCAARAVSFGDVKIPAGTEIMQYFPVPNRDIQRDPDANAFRPERWLNPSDPIFRRRVNTFLSGPRMCPGRDLILRVIKTAIAAQLGSDAVTHRRSTLSDDPLPFRIPADALMFTGENAAA